MDSQAESLCAQAEVPLAVTPYLLCRWGIVAFGCRNTHSAACNRINRQLETCDFPKTWFYCGTHI